MTYRVAAFVKGINVGGNQMVEMATLRGLLEDLGLTDVRTHLQSGNAVFGCKAAERASLASRIEGAIESKFGFRPVVVLRSVEEIERAMADDPLAALASDPARHLVGFLRDAPAAAASKAAEVLSVGDDLVRVVGSHLYMWCPSGISRSPLFKVNFDKVLGTPVTTRNWNTVTKVAGLLRS
ncbi:MAG TPA: DUF1697 domain-containing protein [Acidimicrobiales bacterium]|nr:DUF1697 domain-containing protein [Acidimicrobiales bacterium]